MNEYQTLDIANDRVCHVTISNPPVNVMTAALYQDLVAVTEELASDDSIKVVVFQSADPDFFIAHFDVSLILTFPAEGEAERAENCRPFTKCVSGYEPCRKRRL